MMLNNVDLPQPDGPITPKNSPGLTDSDTSSTAVSTPSGVSNCLTMLSTVRIGSAALAPGTRPDGIATTVMNGVTPHWRLGPQSRLSAFRPSIAGAPMNLQTRIGEV